MENKYLLELHANVRTVANFLNKSGLYSEFGGLLCRELQIPLTELVNRFGKKSENYRTDNLNQPSRKIMAVHEFGSPSKIQTEEVINRSNQYNREDPRQQIVRSSEPQNNYRKSISQGLPNLGNTCS